MMNTKRLKRIVNNIEITVFEKNNQAMYYIQVGMPYNCKSWQILFSKNDEQILMSKSKKRKIIQTWDSFDLKEDHGYFRLLQAPKIEISSCFDLFPEQIQHILDEYFE